MHHHEASSLEEASFKYLITSISHVATQTVSVKSHSPDIVTQEMLNAAGTLAAPFYMLFFLESRTVNQNFDQKEHKLLLCLPCNVLLRT